MKPNPLLVQYKDSLKKGWVLDLGSADGRDIAYLREYGFYEYGVEKNYGQTIEMVTEPGYSMQEPYFNDSWDNIISFYTLHFLENLVAEKTYGWIKEKTTGGGINIIIDFTSDATWEKKSGFYLKPGELKERYSDWEILHYEEKLVPTRDGSQQMAAFIVAKKP